MKFKLFSLLLVSSLITACGFKLKGQYYLPDSLKSIYVTSEKRFSPLRTQLEKRLRQNQVVILDSLSDNKAQLNVLPESFQRRTLSLFPNGQVAEYELIYLASYQVKLPNKKPQRFTVECSRKFQDDQNNALTEERKQALIISEVRVITSDRFLSQLLMIT